MASPSPASHLLLATVLLTVALAGCTQQTGLPQLQVSVANDEVKWGQAAQLTIRNVGQGDQPAPIRVEVASANGTVVRVYPDVTGGRGLPAGGQLSVAWNGTNEAGRPVLWGTYTLRVADHDRQATVRLLQPPNYAMTVDPIPREAPSGSPMRFVVNNTGTVWINGTLEVAAGREETILYSNQARIELAPGESYELLWNGKDPDGEDPEPQRYLVAARVEPDQGPTPFAQDVFRLTDPTGRSGR
ncbi:MAG: hypothetical protein R3185_02430 [Candidatus Thermoplasmatota archaeon]|nr:hypothetical protein [Candidatus Thermoplasmatota archaeon]